jgi:hypothetical protein
MKSKKAKKHSAHAAHKKAPSRHAAHSVVKAGIPEVDASAQLTSDDDGMKPEPEGMRPEPEPGEEIEESR